MVSLNFLSRVPLTLGLGLALTPVLFGLGPWVESRVFPVVRDVHLDGIQATRDGTSLYARFSKVRHCDFIGLIWYQGPNRLRVDFEPDARHAPATRPVGPQYSGPWHIIGLRDLQQSHAVAYHRCHPLWTTVTYFYVPEAGTDAEETTS